MLCLLAKGIGALYRIPLTNIMGVEGIGLYQMVFPLYSVLLTVSGGGLPSAISKTVSQFKAEGDEENAKRTLRVSLVTLLIAGAAASLLLVFFRGSIASLQGNPDAAIAYLGIAPSVTFVAVISCFRGYFQGNLNMLPSGISQITEQGVKMIAGLLLCGYFMRFGVRYAALGALLGVSLSELIAMAVLLIQYAFHARERRKRFTVSLKTPVMEAAADFPLSDKPPLPLKSLLKKIYAVALPVTLGSLVLPVSAVIDSILVINLLTAMGESVSLATKYFGILNGPVGSLVNMPVVITTSLAVLLLPKISGLIKKGESTGACVEKFMRISLLVALPCALALSVFSGEILSVLYRRTMSPELLSIGSALLRISSLTVLYMSVLQLASSVLQAYDKAHKPALNLLKGACLKAVLTIVLIRVFGIEGVPVATVACFAFTCFLDVLAMRKCVSVKLKIGRIAVCAAAGGGAFAVCGKLLYMLFKRFLPLSVALIGALVLAALVYVALVLLLKGVSRQELDLPTRGKKQGQNN